MAEPTEHVPLLDWRDRSHWSAVERPCRHHCGADTHLRDDDKQPSYKTCAEQALADHNRAVAAAYRRGEVL